MATEATYKWFKEKRYEIYIFTLLLARNNKFYKVMPAAAASTVQRESYIFFHLPLLCIMSFFSGGKKVVGGAGFEPTITHSFDREASDPTTVLYLFLFHFYISHHQTQSEF